MSLVKESHLQEIADMLLLNGTLTECPGLVHGKMGIAVFFFHYAQYTNSLLFADYAMDLFGEMLNQLHVNSPADYENGLAGIGVGFNYLILKNFLNVEDDICGDFDARMVRAVLYDPWQDFSKYNGLVGYGRYWITRLRYQTPSVQARECLSYITEKIEEKLADIPAAEQADVYCFLHDLHQTSAAEICSGLLERCEKWDLPSAKMSHSFPLLGHTFAGNIARMYQRSRYFNIDSTNEIDSALHQIPDLDMTNPPAHMGLLAGYAGEGLLRLTALNQTYSSWMNLL